MLWLWRGRRAGGEDMDHERDPEREERKREYQLQADRRAPDEAPAATQDTRLLYARRVELAQDRATFIGDTAAG